jgi:2'-5' RNA ligase
MTLYFLALVLPSGLNEKVLPYKEMMREKFNCHVGLKSPAHVTIVPPFWMDADNEQQLLEDADSLCTGIAPFKMVTDDFSAFKPRTIFIALKPNEEAAHVKKSADVFFSDRAPYEMKRETRPFHPHITIATRDLYKRAFAEAWSYFEKEQFREEWLMDGLSILRHNKKNWDVIHTSQFKNL